MSDHTDFTDKFSSYLDGDLPASERVGLEEHIASFTGCRLELDRFRAMVGGLARLKHRAPPGFMHGIQEQIARRSQGRFFGKRGLLFGRIPFEWVSLVMIIAMLAYLILSLQGSPGGVTPLP
jgi:anti-sigma factor RsiW